MIERGPGSTAGQDGGHQRGTVAGDTFRVGTVEGQTGEELGRHATALAGVVAPAARAGTRVIGLAQGTEQLAVAPHPAEPALVAHRSGPELLVDDEGAGVHVPHGIDQAHDPAGPTQVETGQGLPQRIQMKERVSCQHVFAVGQQPAIDLDLLVGGGVQLVPGVRPTPGRTQAGDPQLGAVTVGQGLETVQLGNIVTGDHHRDLERTEVGRSQMVHGPAHGGVGTFAPHRIVGGGIGPVQAELNVEVVHGRQLGRPGCIDIGTVGGELDPHPGVHRVVDDVEEVSPDHGLAAADVHVEHLQLTQLVDHRHGLGGGKLPRVALAAGGQAMHAGQVAGVGQFPGQTDGGVEPRLELGAERLSGLRGSGHG